MRTGTSLRSYTASLALAAMLALTVRASVVGAAPDPAAWAESSGYNALEANRAAVSLTVASAPDYWDASGYNALEANRVAASGLISAPESVNASGYDDLEVRRVAIARQALEASDPGSMPAAALAELVADADAG